MPAATQIYYWPREFVLRSHGLVQARSYRRASISVLVTTDQAFTIEVEGLGALQTSGVVLGPQARRSGLRFVADSFQHAGWLVDIAPGSVAHYRLLAWLQHQPAREMDADSLNRMQALLRPLRDLAELDLAAAQALHHNLLTCLLPEASPVRRDERVLQVLDLLDAAALDEMAIAPLAQHVGLSESRLRGLVRRELGCNLAQYARWAAAWKTILHWQPGRTLTDAAHAAGFHDLAHANHAANDLFGLSPSRALNHSQVALFADSTVKLMP